MQQSNRSSYPQKQGGGCTLSIIGPEDSLSDLLVCFSLPSLESRSNINILWPLSRFCETGTACLMCIGSFWNHQNEQRCFSTLLQTFNFQVKGAAVKLVLVGDLAPVVSSVAVFGLYDVHFKRVDLTGNSLTGQSVLAHVVKHWCPRSTLVSRSNVSFSCKCFPVLLARSIHFPLNHLTVGLRRRSLASTLAVKLTSPPSEAGNVKVNGFVLACVNHRFDWICPGWDPPVSLPCNG